MKNLFIILGILGDKIVSFLKTPYVFITLLSVLAHLALTPLITIQYLIFYDLALGFAIASGMIEGILWAKTGAESFTWNEHLALLTQAGIFFASMCFSQIIAIPLGHFIILMLSAVCVFVGVKPSVMYHTRNKINPEVYPQRFWAEPSTSSTAQINLSTRCRVWLIGLSIILLIALIIYAKIY